MKLKMGDIFIIIASSCFIVLFTVFIYSNQVTDKSLHIITPDKEYIYSLHTDQQIVITGPLGLSYVHIKNNRVSMHSSPCPLQICIDRGEISNPGEWIVCLPNKILLIIKGKKNVEKDIDILSY